MNASSLIAINKCMVINNAILLIPGVVPRSVAIDF